MMLGPAAFEGVWRVARRIDDRLANQEGLFSGTARFEVTGPCDLSYCESGTLTLGRGPAMTAERRYLWTFAAGEVHVRFADGADFHRFIPQGVGAGTDHPCGDDLYSVTYDFGAWPRWQAEWSVRGPRKDYTSFTQYIRD